MTSGTARGGRLLPVVCAAMLMVLTAALSAPPSNAAVPVAGATTTVASVTIYDTGFVPVNVFITRGETVVWTNPSTTTTHTVVADNGAFSGTVPPGGQFTSPPLTAGTSYHDGDNPAMRGVITLR